MGTIEKNKDDPNSNSFVCEVRRKSHGYQKGITPDIITVFYRNHFEHNNVLIEITHVALAIRR